MMASGRDIGGYSKIEAVVALYLLVRIMVDINCDCSIRGAAVFINWSIPSHSYAGYVIYTGKALVRNDRNRHDDSRSLLTNHL